MQREKRAKKTTPRAPKGSVMCDSDPGKIKKGKRAEEIMDENFSKLVGDTKPQTQETQRMLRI